MRPTDLRCCDMANPIGVDDAPRFSWHIEGNNAGQLQTAYQLTLASCDESIENRIVYDSGKVETDACIEIEIPELNLRSCTVYHWRVRLWDENSQVTQWSDWAYFETGLLGHFKGQWIGVPEGWELRGTPDPIPAPILRKSFLLPEKPVRGRIYVCGLGYSVVYVNGKRIGDEVLVPGVAQYDKTVYYNTFDITDQLIPGENVIGVILGNGWYNSYSDDPWMFKQAPWRSRPKLWLQGRFELRDKTTYEVVSDATWKSSTGPVLADGLRNGEFYDARLEKEGWAEPGFDDTQFQPVQIKRTPGGLRKAQHFTPIRCIETIQAVNVYEVRPGVWVYDFGKNISGFIYLNAKGYRNSEIVFRYSERIDIDGNINREKIAVYTQSGEFQTDHYIMKGADLECWSPEFTYHGFRYVEISGYPGTHTAEAFQAKVICTDFEKAGEFKCSDDIVNRIQAAALLATQTNFHGMPTDCPHREKNGWTGDAWISAEQLLTNFDGRTVYRKWMNDLRDGQRPDGHLPGLAPAAAWGYNRTGTTWGAALIMIPWYQYLYWGDSAILRENYDAMKAYYRNIAMMETEGIVAVDGEEFFAFGDWMPPGGNEARKCPVAITETATYFLMAKVLSKISDILNEPNEAVWFADQATRIKRCFRQKFFTTGEKVLFKQCQSAIAAVLYHEIQETNEQTVFVNALLDEIQNTDKHLDVGFHGMKYLLSALLENDLVELGYQMITRLDYPSFGYMIEQGATTLWEDWEGELSQNHHAFSDVSNFFYQGLAGIRLDPKSPGFKSFILKPSAPKGLDWVEAWHKSPYGRIESNWRRIGDEIEYRCSVPANTKAQLFLFDGTKHELSPGNYTFTVMDEI